VTLTVTVTGYHVDALAGFAGRLDPDLAALIGAEVAFPRWATSATCSGTATSPRRCRTARARLPRLPAAG